MSFLLTVAGLVGAGLAWLELLGLRTRLLAVDLALSWFIGGTWFGLGCAVLRFLGDVELGALAMVAELLLPPAALLARRLLRRRETPEEPDAVERCPWIPRPIWLFALPVLYVIVTLGATLLHGFNTPTNTDDGARVRAFAPMLAFDDEWSPEARATFVVAGAVPTFVPALAWRLTGVVDHFHVNYSVLTTLVALLVLVIALSRSR